MIERESLEPRGLGVRVGRRRREWPRCPTAPYATAAALSNTRICYDESQIPVDAVPTFRRVSSPSHTRMSGSFRILEGKGKRCEICLWFSNITVVSFGVSLFWRTLRRPCFPECDETCFRRSRIIWGEGLEMGDSSKGARIKTCVINVMQYWTFGVKYLNNSDPY